MPSTTSSSPKDEPKQVSNLTAFLVLLAIIGIISACNDTDKPVELQPDGPPPEPALVMPDLRGLSHRDADDALTDAGIDWTQGWGEDNVFNDLSYLHRETEWDRWKVWSTVPAAGTELEVGQDIAAFSLMDDEWDFFDRHPRMPKMGLKLHQDIPNEHLDEHPLSEVKYLVEYRYVPHLAPKGATRERNWAGPRTSDLPRHLDPSIEPKRERQLRLRLKVADDSDQFVATIPRPGAKLRPGRAIVVMVRPDPEWYPEVYGIPDPHAIDWDVYVGTDDDDWNVPGWLCPTRFC